MWYRFEYRQPSEFHKMTDRKLQKTSLVDRPLSKGKSEMNISTFALLFSEMVQYCQNRVSSVPELQSKLSDMGQHVGVRILDLLFIRERGLKRETKLLNILLFIKSNVWKVLFGKEADKLEHANDDERTYYIIEKESVINKFISVPKDKGSLNCAAFTAGIIEAILNGCNFPAKVTAHWHKGTTYMIKFEDSVIARDKSLEQR
ncbi:trafficking protein particle complex subunit 5-like [Lytechinus variegatus]|uniref:trafficking protein particle complex subunit 5-like n=1 Tax=Lytechinus variegatus TaxID=7654 RepID=UPI001BB22A14|nr:trafficking protein particle complex subunit 5-like [Lytechinus variegatus]